MFNAVIVFEKLDAFILTTAFKAPAAALSDVERVILTKRTLATVCKHGVVDCRRISAPPPTRERRVELHMFVFMKSAVVMSVLTPFVSEKEESMTNVVGTVTGIAAFKSQ